MRMCFSFNNTKWGRKKHDNLKKKKRKNLNENTRCQQIRNTNLFLLMATPAGYNIMQANVGRKCPRNHAFPLINSLIAFSYY